MNEDPADVWVTGQLALTLLAIDPRGLGGAHLRARAGPVRDRVLRTLPDGLQGARRIGPSVSDLQLFGGLDVAATLAGGAVCKTSGLLDSAHALILSMAERCGPDLAARLCQRLDQGDGPAVILLDEGAEPDERAPEGLCDRLAFGLSLEGLRAVDLPQIALPTNGVANARALLDRVQIPPEACEILVTSAMQLGIHSLRAPWLAALTARAHAALMGRLEISDDDLRIAAQLVYASRATRLPETDDAPQQEPTDSEMPDDDGATSDTGPIPDDMLVEAVRAMLPPDLIRALAKGQGARGTKGAGAGFRRRGNRRGRPLPSRPGTPSAAKRIDLTATLRAAAPWQKLRARPEASKVAIRKSDLHLRQFEEQSDRLVIFTVDASGSSAMARLAEAKGAVELMLAEAYARRDHVALITFRGTGAELVLPPTRSLVQTKRRLAGLPGGGGTPLAAGLHLTADLARRALLQGMSPTLALLTDGRANVTLNGTGGRREASDDANRMATHLRALNLPSVVVDISKRPHGALHGLALTMGADYMPLPWADARSLSHALTATLRD